MLRRSRTASASTSRSSAVSVPEATRASGSGRIDVNRRIESAGPSTASGGMTTFTREPSARRASAIGLSSSTRRPSGREDPLDRVAQRRLRRKRGRGTLEPPAALDEDRAGAVDHHLLHRGVREQLLERPEADRVAKDQLAKLRPALVGEDRRLALDELRHGAGEVAPAGARGGWALRPSTSRRRSSAASASV